MRKAFFFLSLLFVFWGSIDARAQETILLSIGKETLTLTVARTPEEQKMGLMGRKTLPNNAGMVFFFHPTQFVGFWMKDTPLDLDIAFINEKGIVFHTDSMAANTEDIHYSYGLTAAAIELKKGALKRLGISVGKEIPLLLK